MAGPMEDIRSTPPLQAFYDPSSCTWTTVNSERWLYPHNDSFTTYNSHHLDQFNCYKEMAARPLPQYNPGINPQLASPFFRTLNEDVRDVIFRHMDLPPFSLGTNSGYIGIVLSCRLAEEEATEATTRKLNVYAHKYSQEYASKTGSHCKITPFSEKSRFEDLRKIVIQLPMESLDLTHFTALYPILTLFFQKATFILHGTKEDALKLKKTPANHAFRNRVCGLCNRGYEVGACPTHKIFCKYKGLFGPDGTSYGYRRDKPWLNAILDMQNILAGRCTYWVAFATGGNDEDDNGYVEIPVSTRTVSLGWEIVDSAGNSSRRVWPDTLTVLKGRVVKLERPYWGNPEFDAISNVPRVELNDWNCPAMFELIGWGGLSGEIGTGSIWGGYAEKYRYRFRQGTDCYCIMAAIRFSFHSEFARHLGENIESDGVGEDLRYTPRPQVKTPLKRTSARLAQLGKRKPDGFYDEQGSSRESKRLSRG